MIDTISLGTSLSTSYFYILYNDEKSESIPWDATSSFIKDRIEKMTNISGHICVSRSQSLQSAGYRWVIRFDGMWDDMGFGFSIEHANVRRAHRAISLSVTFLVRDEILSDWIHDDGDATMCTFRHAKYVAGGSGKNQLTFKYSSLPGDTSYGSILSISPSIRLNSGEDTITNALNYGKLSDIEANLVWNDAFAGNIMIDTSHPEVIDVVISGSVDLTETFHAGDILYFEIIFNKPVRVSSNEIGIIESISTAQEPLSR